MSRIGKIARLSNEIRQQLNDRLHDGEGAPTLLQWLNSLPEVQQIIRDQFGNRPVNDQNLSQWRQGGFQDWLRTQDTDRRVNAIIDSSEDLNPSHDSRLESKYDDLDDNLPTLSDRVRTVIEAELAAETQRIIEDTATEPATRWQSLVAILRTLDRMHRTAARQLRTRIRAAHWQAECAQHRQKQERLRMADALEEVLHPMKMNQRHANYVKMYGGDEEARKTADFLIKMQDTYRIPAVPGYKPDPFRPNQTKSK